MPTYSACGVTATLSLADLETSVTKTVDTRPGALNRDGKRIEQVFAAGKSLRERPIGRPIGSDGSESGVMQFIGEDENLPCFVVEASERSRPRVTREEIRESSALPAFAPPNLRKEGSSMNMTDSPLTSLGTTPSNEARTIMPAASRCGTPSKAAPSLAAHDTRESSETFASNRIEGLPLHQLAAPQALVLEVQTCRKSFPQKMNRKRGDMRFPDMKIELFLNGQLADSHFINYQRSGTDHQHKFSGTRIHKQISKPWVYQALEQRGSSELTAEQRWSGIGALLADHVKLRGINKRDQLPPTAQYLSALSNLTLPDRLKDCHNLGVLDVIITTGKGSKQGPIHGYLTSPRAMLSTKYGAGTSEGITELEQDDPFVDTQLPDHSTRATTVSSSENMSAPVSFNALPTTSQVADTSELSSEHLAQIPPSTSPAIPLARRTRSAVVEDNTVPPVQEPVNESLQAADAQPKSKIQLFADKLGIPPDKMSMARQWHSRRGKPSMCKTVTERLNDIRKMSVENQEVAIAEVLEAISSSDAPASPVKAEPPRKRARKDSRAHQVENVSMRDIEDDPVAMEAQQRMHMLIDQGATPDGRLASRVSSLSAHRQPTKKIAPSPLVMAPPPVLGKLVREDSGSSPGKNPGEHGTEAVGPTMSTLSEKQSKLSRGNSNKDESTMTLHEQEPLLGDILQPTTISPQKKSKARSRAASTPAPKPSPDESTGEEALAAFQPPELCQGSVLTYAGPGMQRQTAKSRPGIFDEDELVVGMRFVVV